RTEAQIYCLIRGDSQEHITQKLQSVVDFYFEDKSIDLSRIIAVQGDIAVDGLGLDNDMMKKFRSEIDTVIHTAADVRHFGEYSHFENINVMGTRRILDLVSERDCRFHHISTLSVSGTHVPDMSRIIFKETDFDRRQIIDNVYARSKYEAEELVRNAMTDKLSTTIHRVGNLVGDYKTGKFQRSIETSAFYGIIKAMIQMGVSVGGSKNRLDLTPIDSCSRAVVELMLIPETSGQCLHVFNSNGTN
ncbi:MAG: NAD-dependent epimerase/dehydratase family protein, partial [bacterium]|nr:NAD-dependent epimerase/dehydratase family protein [bacterium]